MLSILSKFEQIASSFSVIRVDCEQISNVKRLNQIYLGRSLEERRLWEKVLSGDLIILINLIDSPAMLTCKVTGKSIAWEYSDNSSHCRPFCIFVECIGQTNHFKIHEDVFFYSKNNSNVSRHDFFSLAKQCHPLSRNETNLNIDKTIHKNENGYSIRVADCNDDFEFIESIATKHPFGIRTAPITLLATNNGHKQGALLATIGDFSEYGHRAAWRIFRDAYHWIKASSVNVVRMYTKPDGMRMWRIQKALLEAIIDISPALIEVPLSIIQGVSYDYQPVAVRLGFDVYPPKSIEESYYYWKIFNIPADSLHYSASKSDVRKCARRVSKERRDVKYWMVSSSVDNVQKGIAKRAWALRYINPNIGRWSSIDEGNCIFLMGKDKIVRGCGIVKNKSKRVYKEYKEFPLWVNFYTDIISDIEINVSQDVVESWYKAEESGGIIPLPSVFGAELMKQAYNLAKGNRMWVDPNPYLLHQREFHIISRQVFVVQAWALKDTIFPVIKKILERNNFTVKYAGDREGMLTFEDIWLMLNESEIIVVDFTHKRPNVYLEYGMALVLGKPIVAISQQKEDMPSDTPNLKCIFYRDKLHDNSLEIQLPKAIADRMMDIDRAKIANRNRKTSRIDLMR